MHFCQATKSYGYFLISRALSLFRVKYILSGRHSARIKTFTRPLTCFYRPERKRYHPRSAAVDKRRGLRLSTWFLMLRELERAPAAKSSSSLFLFLPLSREHIAHLFRESTCRGKSKYF